MWTFRGWYFFKTDPFRIFKLQLSESVLSLLLFVSHLGVISCALCNCFVRGCDDFLLCFVTRSCSLVAIYISEFTWYKKGSVGLNDFYLMMKNVACSDYFLSSWWGMLSNFFSFFFAAGLTLRGHENDLFQAYRLNISCPFCFLQSLQDLSLMRCSLSIFFDFGSRITTFIWWICTLFQSARVYAE